MIDYEKSLEDLRAIWDSGESMHKVGTDLDRYEILFERIQPQVLVETGLYYGGSHHWFAARVPQVITIEHNPISVRDFNDDKWGFGPPPDNGTVVLGDSVEMFDHVRDLVNDEPVLVVLDSNHDTDLVYREACTYGTLVTEGSYLVIEDGILHYLPRGPVKEGNWFDGDPLIAAVKFQAERPDDWIIDHELEDLFPTTQHPLGWLRRC